MSMFSRPLRNLFTPALVFYVVTLMAAVEGPLELVKNETDKILVVLTSKGVDKDQRRANLEKAIKRLVTTRFDFQSMSKSVLSTHWKKATGYERDRFVDFFTQTLVHTYFGAIESYTGEEIRYINEKNRGDRATVDTVIGAEKGDIPVSYKLKREGDEWFVYDVVIEKVSLVSNYRNLYKAIIKTEGVSGLLDRLEAKLKRRVSK